MAPDCSDMCPEQIASTPIADLQSVPTKTRK